MERDLIFPCPHCDTSFSNEHDLFHHALNVHTTDEVSLIIKRSMMKKLSREDFLQVDSQWIFAMGAFHLSLLPNPRGDFTLRVYGSIEPIPPGTKYPTEPEWDKALDLANKFVAAYQIATEKE